MRQNDNERNMLRGRYDPQLYIKQIISVRAFQKQKVQGFFEE